MITSFFKIGTGQLLRTVDCPESAVGIQAQQGEDYIYGGWSGATHYVVESFAGPVAVPRPSMSPTFDKAHIAADGTEIVTLAGLPDPCTLILTDPEGKKVEVEVLGGSETINTDLVGTHTVEVKAFPYLDWKGTFDGY